jgi:signal transduction histidine kinase
MTIGSILRPFEQARTYGALAFFASALVVSGAWLAFLIVGWTLVAVVAITPLIVPALIGFGYATRGVAWFETLLARRLLRAEIVTPTPKTAGRGFWARGWAVATDLGFWRAQAYLLVRLTVGFGLAIALITALAAGFGLLLAPVWYWAPDNGVDIGIWQIKTLAGSFAVLPLGALVLLVTAHLVAPLASAWRTLSSTLLGELEVRPAMLDAARVTRRRALIIHALVVGGLNLVLILIWALTSRGNFWPVWTILALGLPLGIHAWVTWVLARPDIWHERRLNEAFGIHSGVWTCLNVFNIGVWAASGHGYFWPVWTLLAAAIALGIHAAALLLFRRDRELTERIETLETSRAGAVDVQEAELRRIERDLHDGAQARLVALGMSLGMAEQKLAADPEAARALLEEARTGAGEALRELRDLARGIHPPVLADRGLQAAIQALAAASPITVSVSVDMPERPKPPVESAAYFVVAESLANAGKHARATHVDVRVTRVGDVLSVTVTDNGVGGADPSGGGLSGLARRVGALDGTLRVDSPPGGPTTIRAELRCG